MVFLVCRGWSAGPAQTSASAEPAASKTAADLVRTALESEASGNNQARDALLWQALYDYPNDPTVHWQLGQIRVPGGWQSPAEVEQTARQDKRLSEYARRRDASGSSSAADQAALARWCKKNRLDGQQRVHWLLVLQLQPDNAEAFQALGLRPYQGMMLTQVQIKQLKAQQQRVWKAIDEWRSPVAQWRKAAEDHDRAIPRAVRDRIAAIGDGAEMVALEGADGAKSPPSGRPGCTTT